MFFAVKMARMLSQWAFHETKNNPFHFRKSWSVYLVLHQRGQNERDHGWRFTKMAVAEIGLDRVGFGGSWADPPFLFCAVRRGLTPPWSIPALYTPTACPVAIRSGAHTTRAHKAKQLATSSTHTNNQRSSTTNGPYTPRYTATIAVIHRKSQGISGLHKSCILARVERNLIIYRKIANVSF